MVPMMVPMPMIAPKSDWPSKRKLEGILDGYPYNMPSNFKSKGLINFGAIMGIGTDDRNPSRLYQAMKRSFNREHGKIGFIFSFCYIYITPEVPSGYLSLTRENGKNDPF